ncbi:hypothetical protein [Dysgonomonas sp. 37-18]|uniref:hypothetical protein n=1 Tax=Dysgonomonas sp. 37-18 TaxID=1895907 RepID=UPI000A4F34DC|nr:hypothetical protein [Dysgonomonas sp. 37-18]
MNLIDAKVVDILSRPYERGVYWCVDVKVDRYGSITESKVYFNSKEEAEKCSVGYTYTC